MSQWITATFLNDDGTQATGLHPTIIIINLADNSKVINGDVMEEVGNGIYKYLFSGYDDSISYYFICDSGIQILGRYSVGSNEVRQIGTDVWKEQISEHKDSGSFGDLIQDGFHGVGV